MSDKQIQKLIREHVRLANELVKSFGQPDQVRQLVADNFYYSLVNIHALLPRREQTEFEKILLYYERLEGLD